MGTCNSCIFWFYKENDLYITSFTATDLCDTQAAQEILYMRALTAKADGEACKSDKSTVGFHAPQYICLYMHQQTSTMGYALVLFIF